MRTEQEWSLEGIFHIALVLSLAPRLQPGGMRQARSSTVSTVCRPLKAVETAKNLGAAHDHRAKAAVLMRNEFCYELCRVLGITLLPDK